MPDDILKLLDPHAPAEEASVEEPPVPAGPAMVDLFNPDSPENPVAELAANFDPGKHIRWDHRPSVAELDLAAILVEGKPLLGPEVIAQLKNADLVTLKSILGPGDALVSAIGKRKADDLSAWARGRHAAQFALAELAAEDRRVLDARQTIERLEKAPQVPPPAPPLSPSLSPPLIGSSAAKLDNDKEDGKL